MEGLSTALDEITLVLFTTLAPAGALAYGLMALPFIVRGGAMEAAARMKLDRFLCIPIVVAMVGLVASATHLGNPANALYVITGFGRSPLSNEVVCGALFLGAAGIFWLTSFSEGREHILLRRIVAAAISVLGLVFIGAISFAYDASTIISWNTPFTPVSTWLNALSGGPLLAILGLRIARFYTPGHRLGRAFALVAGLALIASVVIYLWWGSILTEMQNSVTSVAELDAFLIPSVALFALLGAVALFFGLQTVRYAEEAPIWTPAISVILMLAAIFVMRLQFYMVHLTVGF